MESRRLRENLGLELEEDDWDSYKDGFVPGMDGFEDVAEYHFVGCMTTALVTVLDGCGGTQVELSPLQLRSLRRGDVVRVQRCPADPSLDGLRGLVVVDPVVLHHLDGLQLPELLVAHALAIASSARNKS